jgi:hypothetical protein
VRHVVDLPVLHHLFVPAADVQQRPYSSALPYTADGERYFVGVVPDPASPRPGGDDELDRLERAAATGRLVFGLAIARAGGRFFRIGSLHVEERLPPGLDALRFTPFNCGGGLRPAGVLNRLRAYAYPMSQRAWARRSGQARAQAEAEQLLRGSGSDNLRSPMAGARGLRTPRLGKTATPSTERPLSRRARRADAVGRPVRSV